MKKRILSLLLCLCLLIGLLPTTAFAAMPSVMWEKGGNSTATVYVGGEAMTASDSTESWYTGGEVVVVEPVSYSAHLYLDSENGGALTLEIKDLRVSGKEDHAESKGGGHLHNGSADDSIQRRKYRYCRCCV